MSTIQEIEQAISRLSIDELATFRDWFAEFEAEMWDRQIEIDATSGRLDSMSEEALKDAREGRCTDL